MKITTTLITILIVSVQSFSQLRIVCMGNSITQGTGNEKLPNNRELSYRYWLWEKMDSFGYNFDMVGFHNKWFGGDYVAVSPITGNTFDNDHDAYYGIKSDGLLNGDPSTGWTGAPLPKLSTRLSTYTPDIALLHIGTNDADKDTIKTINNIKAIIDELRAKNPNVVILLAKLITVWKPINRHVDSIAQDKSTAQSPVKVVDMATGFINNPELQGSMTFDWVHPNQQGQQFMATRWYKAIVANLPDKIKPILIGSLIAKDMTSNSLVLTWPKAKDNYGVFGYDVYRDGVKIKATTDTTYTVTGLSAASTYQFKIVAKDFASNTAELSASFSTVVTGIAKYENLSNVMLFPTITSSTITLQGATHSRIQVLNTFGTILATHNSESNSSYTINLEGYTAGNYFVKITRGDQAIFKRVVVQ